MIKAHFGIKEIPFARKNITLLSQQQSIYDILNVHSKQGGLCIIAGEPGVGKTQIVRKLQEMARSKSIEVPTINRTMHSYLNIIKILLEAFKLDEKHLVNACEADIIKEAYKLNNAGKTLITILDDAHLIDTKVLRKLRLLFDAFPRNHNLVLIGQIELLQRLAMTNNEDIKSRITYSAKLNKLNSSQIEEFIFTELDECGLGHNIFDQGAMELIIRSTNGTLRQCKNLCLGSIVQAVIDRKRNVTTNMVNSILMQPHWRNYEELLKQ